MTSERRDIEGATIVSPAIKFEAPALEAVALPLSGSNAMAIPNINSDLIPKRLPKDLQAIYHILLKVKEARALIGTVPLPLVVVTDLAKDYDDLTATVVYKELHRLGLVELRGLVANLMPADKRARFGRGALDSLGLPNIPIAKGLKGVPENDSYPTHEYEFDCPFMAAEEIKLEGEELLFRLCKDAMLKGEKLTLLCLSSLEDISIFAQKFPNLLRKAVSNIVLQGGYNIVDGILQADGAAANNHFHPEAAKSFHTFMQNSRVPSVVYTKAAAFAVNPPLMPELFEKMDKTRNAVGQHLNAVQERQELEFYTTACGPVEKRFRPEFDQEHFLRNRTTWYQTHTEKDERPDGKDVIPYCKLTVYDALAALGAAGEDAVNALEIISMPPSGRPSSIHIKVGDGKDGNPGINGPKMSIALRALLYGSILAVQQGLSSNPS